MSALVVVVGVRLFGQDDAGYTDPVVAHVQQLEQELATRDADIVGLRADLAVCQATVEQSRHEYQSLVLTNDVAHAIETLKARFPGTDWTWDNERRRIVPVKEHTK